MTGETTTTTLTENVRAAYNMGAYHAFEEKGQFWRSAIWKETPMQSGSSAVFDKWDALSVSTSALNELTDGDPTTPAITQVSVTPYEYGKHVQTSKKWRLTAYGENEKLIAQKLGLNASATLDTLARSALDAQTGATWVRYAGTRAAVAEIQKTDELTSDDFREARALLEERCEPFKDGYYRCYVHGKVLKDIKDETGITGWTYKAAYTGELSKGIAIDGEEGVFEGFRVIRTSRAYLQESAGDGSTTSAASADVFSTYFVGSNALGVAYYGTVPEIKVSDPKQMVGDAFGRHQLAAWYAFAGFGAIEDDACLKFFSSSSIADNGA